jgi:hypothetical protein
MSPTESELRAALRSGEGGGLDPDAVISRARGVRHARRVRFGSIAAAVVIVGGVAAGVTALQSGGSQHPAAQHGATSGANQNQGTAAAQCPAQPPHLMMPGGGGTGQFGAAGPLFARPVESLTVCGYVAPDLNAPVRHTGTIELTNAAARDLAASLEHASLVRTAGDEGCLGPMIPETELLVAAHSRAGALEPVTVTTMTACGNTVTNGTAIRYDWNPPAGLRSVVDGALVPGATSSPTSGRRYSHGPAPRPTR